MTDELIMAEMLNRATNPAKEVVDELGVQMFCRVVRCNAELVHKAQEMIVEKIRSTNTTEATRAIALLEECMTRCGTDFQIEAAKFRFLNELIRLVSKKYQGAETPHEIKQRIMECLLLWTTEFPKKQKVRDAYEMLRKEGGIEHGQSETSMVKRESVLGALDEEMFAKLVKSNDPENFKRANRLLQYRMTQEARRNELLLQHKCVLQEVQNAIQVLNQMLDGFNPNEEDEHETMHELYKICKKHKPMFQHLPELLDQSDSQLIADTLEANGMLLDVMKRYKELISSPSSSKNRTPPNISADQETTNHSATASVSASNTSNDADDFKEFLDLLTTNNSKGQTKQPVSDGNTADMFAELHDIFGSMATESVNAKEPQQEKYPADLLNHTVLLEPECVSATAERINNLANGVTQLSIKELSSYKMPAIDVLSEELFQKSLPTQERMTSFKRESEKVTLNDLVRERTQIKPTSPSSPVATLRQAQPLDDVNILDGTVSENDLAQATITPVVQSRGAEKLKETTESVTSLPTKSLSEVSIDLDSVTPTGEQRIVLDDDDIQISLNFTEDRPSKHVSVFVITAQNKSKQPVKDFQFEASVKKPCKVRLLQPTDNAMPPQKPFRPATPVNQIMLLLNPTGNAIDITCIVGYKLGDDPDPVKESITVENIPFVP